MGLSRELLDVTPLSLSDDPELIELEYLDLSLVQEPVSVKFSADDDLVNSTSGGLAGKSEVLNSLKISSISTGKLGVLILKIKSISGAEEEEFIRKNEGPKELRSNKG